MATQYGLSVAGFTIKPLDVILADLRVAFEGKTGYVPPLTPDDPLAVLLGITANEISKVWELAQAIYSAWQRGSAGSISLDNISSLLLLPRRGTTYTTATVTLGGTSGTVVPAGKVVSTSTDVRFTTDEACTIPGDVTVTAQVAGPTEVGDHEITTIVTPVAGWSTVTNAADAVPGLAEENDLHYRARGSQLPAIAGRGTVAAILSRLLDPDQAPANLQYTAISENATDAAVDGQPAHSIEVVVYPETTSTDELAVILWGTKPAGIELYGTETAQVIDVMGVSHDVKFSYAEAVSPTISILVRYLGSYPSNGGALITAAVEAFENGLGVGEAINLPLLMSTVVRAVATDDNPSGGIIVLSIFIDGSEDTYNVSMKQIAQWDDNQFTLTEIYVGG